ncbi:class A beta-lactamase-related serine hydrolase [Sphingomonas gei]|uniref:Class A beta-lactamase-related serine hydrolase n=1 Tax=Sphingomonas gei TaxID=1395960 RepID=A0A4S1XA60_9SPHN|nr:serine hydrolase domain-containing protein [Sphingomonas gei]TGX52593.1 class A beta-lactamase-related serine hydrolase [Sphingomonas gei]
MRRALLLMPFTILLAQPASAGCVGAPPPAGSREAAFVRQVVERTPNYLKEFSVPGGAVAVIENGKVVLARGFGMADAARGSAVTGETLFNIGSTSKSIAAWGAMRLVREGKLSLDDPVDAKLKRWHLPASTYPVAGVTLRRLLSHTAGLSVSGYRGWGPDDIIPTLEQSLSGQTNGAGALTLVAVPGSQMSYSGGGYTLVQLLVEETAGAPFAGYMRDSVLRPLGMNDSSFSLTPSVLGQAARAYDELGEETPTPRFAEVAAAGLYTTIGDMACYALASIGNDRSAAVVGAGTLDLMTSPAPATDGQRGLGYAIQPAGQGYPDGVARVGHDGGNRGWQSFFWVGRGNRDGLIVLTNGSNGWNVSNQIVADWMEWKMGKRLPIPRSIAATLLQPLHGGGVEAAIARYKQLETTSRPDYIFNPNELNKLGYALLHKGRVRDAVAIWELNAAEYPADWNVHDSLGDGYAAAGPAYADKAVASFKRSLSLNPSNAHARDMIPRVEHGDAFTF